MYLPQPPNHTPPRVKYLTAGQAADLLGVNRRTVARWCESGRIEAHRTAGGDVRGGNWRIHPAVIEGVMLKTTTKGRS